MDQEEGKPAPPPILGYDRKQRSPAEIMFAEPAVLVCVIALIVGSGIMCGTAASAVTTLLILAGLAIAGKFMKPNERSSAQSAAEDDAAELAAEESRKTEMLAAAKMDYAQGPIGSWRSRQVDFHSTLGGLGIIVDTNGGMTVRQELLLELGADGHGRFQRIRRGESSPPIETLFQFKPAQLDILSVQLTSPQADGWHEVRFGFEARRGTDDDPELVLWLDGQSPLTPDLLDYWPFDGAEFRRES